MSSDAGQAYIAHDTGHFGTATLDSSTVNDSVWDIGGPLRPANVPEPGSLIILVTLAGLASRRRR